MVDTTGNCDVDTLAFTTSSSRNYRNLCGTNTGQHIYIETGREITAQTLAFTIAAASTGSSWKIKISQIECFAPWKAPSDCLQFYTGVSGNVQTFNYAGNVVLRNQQYSACIRKESGYCGIEWKPTQPSTATQDTFDLGALTTAATVFFNF